MTDATLTTSISHDGTDAESLPVFAEERRILGIAVSTWPNIIAPLIMGSCS